MPRLTSIVLAHRRLVIVSWIVLTCAGAWAAATISDSLSHSFDAPGRPAFAANAEIVKRFANGGVVAPVVLVATSGRGERLDVAEASRQLRRLGDQLPGRRVAAPDDAGGRALVSDDDATVAVLVFPPPGRPAPDAIPEAVERLRAVTEGVRVGGGEVAVTGIDALVDDTGGGGVGLLVEIAVGALGALLVLVAVFSSVAALLPLLIALVSILTSFLALRGLASVTEISFVVQFIVGLVGLGIAIDYSLLVVVRWREERARGADSETAIATAMLTAGRAVAFSGTTVAIGLLALVVVPVPTIRSIGYGGLLIPLVSVVASLTLLPVLLAALGPRLDWPRASVGSVQSRRWRAWSSWVVLRRWPAAIGGMLVLGVLLALAVTLNPGRPAVDALSSSGVARDALMRLESSGIGTGVLTPLEVVGDDDDDGASRRLADVEGVRGALEPVGEGWRRGGRALVAVVPEVDASSDAGEATLARVRGAVADFEDARVGGPAAQTRDLTDAIYGSFVPMVALISLITLVLLTRAFRSVVLPLKALALNVLSVGASFGVIVLVWQLGYGSQLFGIASTGAITNWVPLAMFAFLFGLSMDYEVFILSRMRESYDENGDTDRAVVDGLAATGRLVTSAALILVFAFVALAAGPATELKIFATGLAAGIALDATVVRALLVPALVTLLGRSNWWLTPRLARLLGVAPSR